MVPAFMAAAYHGLAIVSSVGWASRVTRGEGGQPGDPGVMRWRR